MYLNKTILISVFTLAMAGCNGVSGDNGDDPFGSGQNTVTNALSVVTKAAECSGDTLNSVTTEQRLCVQATLTGNGQPVSGAVVNFTTPLGELSNPSRLTDSNGVAQVSLSSATLGAGTLQVTQGTLTASTNFEFVAADQADNLLPVLSLGLLLDGQAVSQFASDQAARVRSQLLDGQGQPLAGKIVRFSSELGILSPATALTDEQGIAETNLTANGEAIGAASLMVQYGSDQQLVTQAINFQILAQDAVEQNLRIGHFADGQFIDGQLGFSASTNQNGDIEISAGATLGVLVAVVDANQQLVTSPNTLTLLSNCVQSGKASLDEQVISINGIASATYVDTSCAGAQGAQDNLSATLNVNGQSVQATGSISILPEALGSIQFIDAAPQSIVLQGAGGQGGSSVSTLTFQVNGSLGNPLGQQQVNFALNTQVGGLTLTPDTAITNSQGQVSTRVMAGSVPTAVRVTASAANGLQTQSDLLSVNTGLPEQKSMSLSTELFNPEAGNVDGVTVPITARLADSFNNPVPDGTVVNFTSEGGTIDPSCQTQAGSCRVNWVSSMPRPANGRVTILASAVGHETLIDRNGNNVFDDTDGGALPSQNNHGIGQTTIAQGTTGFIDYSEAWRDDNENKQYDIGEIFLDYNNNGSFDAADGLFNGPQCQASSLCGSAESNNNSLHVRKALRMVMAGSQAYWHVYAGDPRQGGSLAYSNDPTAGAPNSLTIAAGTSADLYLLFSDQQGQVMPNQTTLQKGANIGGQILFTVPNAVDFAGGASGHVVKLETLDNSGGTLGEREFNYVIVTPANNTTAVQFSVN